MDKFELRPLTRGEIKALRAKGFKLAGLTVDQADDAVDAVVDMVLGDRSAELDDAPYEATLKVFKEILNLTYRREESSKK